MIMIIIYICICMYVYMYINVYTYRNVCKYIYNPEVQPVVEPPRHGKRRINRLFFFF